jgi:type II secretory pathway component PulL
MGSTIGIVLIGLLVVCALGVSVAIWRDRQQKSQYEMEQKRRYEALMRKLEDYRKGDQ